MLLSRRCAQAWRKSSSTPASQTKSIIASRDIFDIGGTKLARAYANHRLSDLMVVFTAAWVLNLAWDALSSGPWMLLPLAWIPLVLALLRRRAPARAAPAPTLLVLRVFKQDANVSALFDDVVERWRSVGNTVLIAGTDLVERTVRAFDMGALGADDTGEREHAAAPDPAEEIGFGACHGPALLGCRKGARGKECGLRSWRRARPSRPPCTPLPPRRGSG